MNGVLLSGDARLFLAERGSGCGRPYDYYACMKLGSAEKNYGEVQPIECPANSAGDFVIKETYRGEEGPWTTSLSGYKPRGVKSPLARLSANRRPIDLQLHFGRSGDLSDPENFESMMVIENAVLHGYNADPIGALNGGETAPVLESLNVTAERAYEVFPIGLLRVAREATADSVVIDVAARNAQCDGGPLVEQGEFYAFRFRDFLLDNSSDGVTIMHSTDNGVSWEEFEFSTPSFDVTAPMHSFHIVCASDGILLIGNEIVGLGTQIGVVYFVAYCDMVGGDVLNYRRSAMDDQINDVAYLDGKVYGVGVGGLVYVFSPATLSYTTIELLDDDIWDFISGVDGDNFMVASVLGRINVYRRGIVTGFDCLTIADDDCPISAIAMRTPDEWVVATCNGPIYCTTDRGKTFSLVVNGTAAVVDIKYATRNVGYYLTRSPCQVYRTTNGGASWLLVRDYRNQVNESLGYWHTLAIWEADPNVFVAAGRITENQDECSPGLGDCQHTCEAVSETDEGILVSGQIL